MTSGPLHDAFSSTGTKRRIRAGTTLFPAGSEAREVFLIEKGRVKCTAASESGRESLLAVRGPGDLLGELSALDGSTRSAAAIAIDPVELYTLSAPKFVEILGTYPGAGLELVKVLSARLRDADRTRAEFGSHDSMARVARRLLELADRFGTTGPGAAEQIRIDLPLTQDELASWTGASREAVAKALRVLRDENVIETGRRVVTVLDEPGLRKRALI